MLLLALLLALLLVLGAVGALQCNLGKLPEGSKPLAYRRRRFKEDGLETRLSEELVYNITVVDPHDESE